MKLCLCALAFASWTAAAFGQTAQPVTNSHNCNEAFYPPQAILDNREGKVTIGFLISPGGTVINPVLVQSSGDGELDRAALACVKTWTYGENVVQSTYRPWKVEVIWKVEPGPDDFAIAVRNFRADAWACVRRSAVAHALEPEFSGILEAIVLLPRNQPATVQIMQSSGRAALDGQFQVCAAKSPWLAKINAAVSQPTFSANGFAWYPGLAN